jgi:protein TonB
MNIPGVGVPGGVPGGSPGGVVGGIPPPPPPPPPPPQVVKAGGEVDFPTKISGGDPIYPSFAKAAKLQGTIYLDAILAKDGTVKDLKVLRGPEPLRQAALDAVKNWKYTPTKLNGVPVEVQMTVIVHFRLAGG